MNVSRYLLPHVLALSTSSPFWQGRRTGLKSYRSIVFRNFPRTRLAPALRPYSADRPSSDSALVFRIRGASRFPRRHALGARRLEDLVGRAAASRVSNAGV